MNRRSPSRPSREQVTAPQRGLPGWVRVVWVVGVIGGLAVVAVLAVRLTLPRVFAPKPEEEATPIEEEETAPPNTPTPEPTVDPILALAGVTRNADWTPVIQDFDGVEMALVPAGCFMMGSEDGGSDELPVHKVCFVQPFWIDVYEVTNAQYGGAALDCMEVSSYDSQPCACTDWFDSVAHCESRGARLPTEAEWEYAARGPDGLVYPWGNDFVADNVVYHSNSGGRTWEVGSRPGGISWVGAYDLSGNVWEWVNDWYADSYPAGGQVNPQGPGSGEYRVLRGGSWLYIMSGVRAANRYWDNPSDLPSTNGFRCARDFTPPAAPEDTPTATTPPSRGPTVDTITLAMAGVTSNDDWKPYTEEKNGVEMALIPAGCFMMGSEDGGSDELPVHEVCFEEPFWIDVYEVTNAQYGSSGNWSGDNLPREFVSWFDAAAHCESRGARLPTEAEWEYAARGPDGLIYPWGNDFDGELLNYCDKNCGYDWADRNVDDGYPYTAPVGTYPGGVSWVGAYDLSGNVWEWVNDRYADNYPSETQVNPAGPGYGKYRVLRGGSWDGYTYLVRAALRHGYLPSGEYNLLGFRCALSYSP